MNVLTIADTHGELTREELREKIAEQSPDICFLLGDILYNDMKKICEIVPCFKLGICGNHEYRCFLDNFPDVFDLDKSRYTHQNRDLNKYITFGGLSGSVKYTEDHTKYFISQKEATDVLDRLGPVDILLTHDKPCFRKPKDYFCAIHTDAHAGFYGIGKYILENKPKYVFHGHLHKSDITIIKKTTTVISCYGVENHQIEI